SVGALRLYDVVDQRARRVREIEGAARLLRRRRHWRAESRAFRLVEIVELSRAIKVLIGCHWLPFYACYRSRLLREARDGRLDGDYVGDLGRGALRPLADIQGKTALGFPVPLDARLHALNGAQERPAIGTLDVEVVGRAVPMDD